MIRAFLSFLEMHGAGEVLARELREALAADGDEGREALVAEGILRASHRATVHECEGLGCAREVREKPSPADGARRFLAVCTRSPRECETVLLTEDDLAQDQIVLGAFVAVVQRVLAIEPALQRPGPSGPHGPAFLGERVEGGVARDVFFARNPRGADFVAFLSDRRRAARPALVLVPTALGIDPGRLAQYGTGHVQIAALSDRLTVRRGRIAAARALRAVPDAAPEAEPSPGIDSANDAPPPRAAPRASRLPRVTRWNEATFYSVEPADSIGLEVDRRARRLTATELGLVHPRTGEPVRAFRLLQRICEGNGVFDTRPWSGRENGKQIVSELRRGLCAAFEIAESPISAYSRGTKSWKTKFRALAGAPSEVRALERALRKGE